MRIRIARVAATTLVVATFFALCPLPFALCPEVLHAQASSDTSMSGARADARALTTADSLRRAILGYATFAGFGDTPCATGDIRTFERDTAGVVQALLARFEVLVLSYGAYVSLDNDAGTSLLRAVVRLEGGGPGPAWDTMTGSGPRAFNPVLPIRFYNTETKQCDLAPGNAPDGIVLPQVTGFRVPRDSGAFDFTVGYGPAAISDLRNFFFSRHANDTSAVLHSVRVNAHAMWENYAIVGVVRDVDRRGAVPVERESTGAVYAFHRVDTEWRLLAVVRSW
jgi:hypothetical protein